ncbi:hypothetical protein SCUP234_03736 [Seiridium cupressi]
MTVRNMASTFLDWLTLPNPIPNSTPCKDGPGTKIVTVYGPHKVRPWTDVTWENLNASFGDVLRKQADSPRIRNRDDIDSEKLTIYEEDSVTFLMADWTEKIVQHSLNGTRKPLMASPLKESLAKGTVHFIKNTGRGHLPDEKGILQKPDWCIYQKGQKFTYLVPGDSKPAMKWQSEWIECDDKSLRRKAALGIQQLTKYMYLAQTRYGFVISEEELVPLRLSTFDRSLETLNTSIQDNHARQILDSSGDNFEEDEWFEQDISLQAGQELAAFLADADGKTGFLLEYGRIPWKNHGSGMLTINLTLWWLPMLAVQNASIEETQAYKPLSQDTEAEKLPVNNQQAAKVVNNRRLGFQAPRRLKRKAQNSSRAMIRPESRRTSVNHDSSDIHSTLQPRMFRSPRPGRTPRDDDAGPRGALDLSFSSDSIFPRRSTRKRTKGQAMMADSFTSVACSSQATDSVAVSSTSIV